jgi:hypothetical protein
LNAFRWATLEPKQAEAADFDTFDQRLAAWLPQAVALESVGIDRDESRSTSLLAAVERADIEQAFSLLDTDGGDIHLPELDLPGYVFFPDTSAGSI